MITDAGDKSLNGRTIADLAQAQGKAPIDAILDLAIKDDLRTVFTLPSVHQDQATWERRAALSSSGARAAMLAAPSADDRVASQQASRPVAAGERPKRPARRWVAAPRTGVGR